jgi:hypothetical protein
VRNGEKNATERRAEAEGKVGPTSLTKFNSTSAGANDKGKRPMPRGGDDGRVKTSLMTMPVTAAAEKVKDRAGQSKIEESRKRSRVNTPEIGTEPLIELSTPIETPEPSLQQMVVGKISAIGDALPGTSQTRSGTPSDVNVETRSKRGSVTPSGSSETYSSRSSSPSEPRRITSMASQLDAVTTRAAAVWMTSPAFIQNVEESFPVGPCRYCPHLVDTCRDCVIRNFQRKLE